jgi:predicted ArsR family transcriptional regulator
MTPHNEQARTTRGRPFAEGNSGRPRGSRNKSTQMAAALEDEAPALLRKAIEIARDDGDKDMLKFLLGRVLPKERPIRWAPPTDADTKACHERIAEVLATGEITVSEAVALTNLVESRARSLANHDLLERWSTSKRC